MKAKTSVEEDPKSGKTLGIFAEMDRSDEISEDDQPLASPPVQKKRRIQDRQSSPSRTMEEEQARPRRLVGYFRLLLSSVCSS